MQSSNYSEKKEYIGHLEHLRMISCSICHPHRGCNRTSHQGYRVVDKKKVKRCKLKERRTRASIRFYEGELEVSFQLLTTNGEQT